MDAQTKLSADLPDIQASGDERNVTITYAGVDEIRFRANIHDVNGGHQNTIVKAAAAVHVPAGARGAHMSRLVETLFADRDPFFIQLLTPRLKSMLLASEARKGRIAIEFPWFIEKTAPVSGVSAETDVEAGFTVEAFPEGSIERTQTLSMPVTTLCPCSKEISEYGAHNQRATVRLQLNVKEWIPIEELVTVVESAGSCEIYSLLKRSDERYVTQKAYENAKFVEDVVRDLYLAFREFPEISKVAVRVTSHESIHNHDAYAQILE